MNEIDLNWNWRNVRHDVLRPRLHTSLICSGLQAPRIQPITVHHVTVPPSISTALCSIWSSGPTRPVGPALHVWELFHVPPKEELVTRFVGSRPQKSSTLNTGLSRNPSVHCRGRISTCWEPPTGGSLSLLMQAQAQPGICKAYPSLTKEP